MTICVFLGPTLPLAEARAIFDADYLSPARAGDIAALVGKRPRAIALVDGLFEQVPSVRHKEILFALSSGIRVFGASSMGALRAAELAAFGMEGVGSIFEGYRDGICEDDDEVAVLHGPADRGYPAFSEAMVNLRAGLAAALSRGEVSRPTHDRLIAMSKVKYYPDRSWEGLLADADALAIPADERAAIAELARSRPNAKRDDARLLLRRLAEERARGMAPHAPRFDFEATASWKILLAQGSSTGAGSAIR